ncbi:MAG: SAM-dependent methyltransferase, partial [Flavobacteriales bacterium]
MSDGAFNQMAADYDAVFTNSKIGRLQREIVWSYLNENLEFGTEFRVLELNCGTGEDASIFAKKGCEVTATDISSEMLAVARCKAAKQDVSSLIEFKSVDLNAIDKHTFEHKYDLVFSNFGGLNCVSKESLQLLSEKLQSLLKPEGRFVAVVMPSFCLMESVYFLLKFQFEKAFRRLRNKVAWTNDEGETISIYYYSPSQFKSIIGERFTVQSHIPVGLWVPPSYTEQFFQRHQRILGFLSRMEKSI